MTIEEAIKKLEKIMGRGTYCCEIQNEAWETFKKNIKADRQRLEDEKRSWYSEVCFKCSGFSERAKFFKKQLAKKDVEIDKLKNCLSNKKCMHEDNFKSILDEKDAEIKRLRGSIKDLLEARKSEIERLEAELGKVLNDLAKLEEEKRFKKCVCPKCNSDRIKTTDRTQGILKCQYCGYRDFTEMFTKEKPALTAEDAKVLARYLNGWADCDKHPESSENGKITKYYEGYQQAVRDIIQKIGWERFEGWCGYDSKRKVQNKPTRKV